jgi:hypothetical protein
MNAAGRQVEDFADRCPVQNDIELVLRQFPEENAYGVPEIHSISFVASTNEERFNNLAQGMAELSGRSMHSLGK